MKEEIQNEWKSEQQEKEDLRLNRDIAFKRSLEIEMQEMQSKLDKNYEKILDLKQDISPQLMGHTRELNALKHSLDDIVRTN